MVFKESTYSVLIVSSSEQFYNSTNQLLSPSDYWPVKCAKSAGEARRILLEREFDLVLINSPLSDEFGTKLATDICANEDSGVLLFVKSEVYDDVYAKVMEAGVMVIPKPTSTVMVSQSLRMLCSQRERIRLMEQKQATVEEKIQEIRIINKAKWLLIEKEGMNEADAHRYIEKQAMNQRISKKEFAESVMESYS